jgi:hypothetical protein
MFTCTTIKHHARTLAWKDATVDMCGLQFLFAFACVIRSTYVIQYIYIVIYLNLDARSNELTGRQSSTKLIQIDLANDD